MKDDLYQVNTPPKALDLLEIPGTPAKSIPLLDIPGSKPSDPIFETYSPQLCTPNRGPATPYSSRPAFPQAATKIQQAVSDNFIDSAIASINVSLKDYYDAHRHEKDSNTLMAWAHKEGVSDLVGVVKYSAALFISIFTTPPFLEDFRKLITGMKNVMIEDGGYNGNTGITMGATIQTYAEVLRLLLAEFLDARDNILTLKGNDSWAILRMLTDPQIKDEITDVIRIRFNTIVEAVLPQLSDFLSTDNI